MTEKTNYMQEELELETTVNSGEEPLTTTNSESTQTETTNTTDENPATSAMGKSTHLMEDLGSQYEVISERATPDGGSITNSVEPELKKIEESITFNSADSENYEKNVTVGGLGGNGGVDLDTIDKTGSDEYDSIMERDSKIKRVEITNIENQKKVYEMETEMQGQQDDGKGLFSNSANKNGEGTSVNPETHTLCEHDVEEKIDVEAPVNDSNNQFNAGELLKPKDDDVPVSDDIEEPEPGENTEEIPDNNEEEYIDGKEAEEVNEEEIKDTEIGNEETPEDNTPEETPDDNTPEETPDDEVTPSDDSEDPNADPDDTNEVEFADENIDPEESDNNGSYTIERIPGIADDDGHSGDLSDKKGELETPNYEEHGLFDGSDQAGNVNTDGTNGVDEKPTSPELSEVKTQADNADNIERQENTGNMGADLDGYGVPEDRSDNGEPNDIENNDEFADENVDPEDIDYDEVNSDHVEEEPEDLNTNQDGAGESYMGFGYEAHHFDDYYHGFESEEIDIIEMINELVD